MSATWMQSCHVSRILAILAGVVVAGGPTAAEAPSERHAPGGLAPVAPGNAPIAPGNLAQAAPTPWAATPWVVPGLSDRTLAMALRAHGRACLRGDIERPLLTIIDYSLPSTEKRLWVLDLERGQVLFHELVAHGRESGDNEARAFSNLAGSHQSSLGVFRTGVEYEGEHGISLRLQGLEPGINDRAEERAIVLHGADYVSEQFAARFGRLGRSFGCPAVRAEIADSLIHTIRDGTLLYASYPDSTYAVHSSYVAP